MADQQDKTDPLARVPKQLRAHAWRKGQTSPNPKGRPKGPSLQTKFRRALAKRNEYGSRYLDSIVQRLLESADAGHRWAIRECLDRGFGKPTESLELTGEQQQTINIVFEDAPLREVDPEPQAQIEEPEADVETSASRPEPEKSSENSYQQKAPAARQARSEPVSEGTWHRLGAF